MTREIAIVLGLFGVMTALFFVGTLPLEFTALVFLVLLTLSGYLTPDQAVSGFSSPTVVALIGMFFLTTGLKETGLSRMLADFVLRVGKRGERSMLTALMTVTAAVSAFMPNMSAAAIMLPATLRVAEREAISPSRLLMPMAFASVLGGMLTIVGTQPNIIAADLLRREGLEPFHFTSFTLFGGAAVILGVWVMAAFGRRFLPTTVDQSSGRAELAELYRLNERLISVRIPKGSSIHGRTLAELQFGGALGARVFSVTHAGSRRQLPGPQDVLHEEDVLVIGGRREDIESMRKFNRLNIDALELSPGEESGVAVHSAAVRIDEGSDLVDRTLREIHFQVRHGALVVRVDRAGESLCSELGALQLRPGDVLYLIAPGPELETFVAQPGVELVTAHIELKDLCRQRFFTLHLGERSPLAGTAVRDSRLGEMFGVTIAGLRRAGTLRMPVAPTETFESGDTLIVTGDPEKVRSIARLAELEILPETERTALESADIAMVEVILSPRSELIGQTLRTIRFRERYGMQVVALWREGRPRRSHLGEMKLSLGDAILLQLPREKLPALERDENFVILSQPSAPPRSPARAAVAMGGFAILVLLSALRIIRIDIAALAGAVFVVLGGAVRMEQVYREIDWRVILLIAALLPFGLALENCGAAAYLTQQLLSAAASASPMIILMLLCILSSFLSQVLDGSVAVIMLGPIVFRSAQQLHCSPYPLMMAVTLGASVAFMSPISTRSNMLVVGAGGYRSKDFLVPGLLLTLTLFALFFVMVPLLYPF